MGHFCFILALIFFQDVQVPYKSKEYFEVKLDYSFKQRPANNGAINLAENNHTAAGPLPFLSIEFKVLSLEGDETRLRIVTNEGKSIMSRKVEEQQMVKFDMGFTADLKDRIRPHEYTLYFLSAEKKEKSRVVISVARDGSFFVNEEKRGKL